MIELPGYRLVRPLGHGGMSTVYLAEQTSLGRKVALKLLLPGLGHDSEARQRFLREARLAASLHHPQIVAIHDVGEHEGQAYMAMAFESAGTLADEIGQHGVTEQRALQVLREVASALDYAHQRGVVHRDVKPENILRREDGHCLLSDFGIAFSLGNETGLTREGVSVGTPAYMSPEQLRGQPVDGRSDLYSLGVVLFQLLTGALPYTGTDGWSIGLQHLSSSLPRLAVRHQRLQSLLDALMAKEPEQRIPNAGELIRRIDHLLSGRSVITTTEMSSLPAAARPAMSVRPARRLGGRRGWAFALGLVALSVSLAMLLPAMRAPSSDSDQRSATPSTPPEEVSTTPPTATIDGAIGHQYRLGREFMRRAQPADYAKAAELFRQVMQAEPNYAPAHAEWVQAELSRLQFVESVEDPLSLQAELLQQANRAIELDPTLAQGWSARATLRFTLIGDWAAARADFDRALQLDPEDADSHRRLGLLHAALGEVDGGIASTRRALELDPLAASAWNNLGYLLNARGDLHAAREAHRRALQLSPGRVSSLFNAGVAELLDARWEAAASRFDSIPEGQQFRLVGQALLAHSQGQPGAQQSALDALLALPQQSPFWIAAIHAWSGDPDQALIWLQRAFASRDYFYKQAGFDPLLRSLQDEPDFIALLDGAGLRVYAGPAGTASPSPASAELADD